MRAKDVVKELAAGVASSLYRTPDEVWLSVGVRFEEHVREQMRIRFRGNPRPEWTDLNSLMGETLLWVSALVKLCVEAGVLMPVTANVAQFERVFEHVTGFTVSHKPKEESARPPASVSAGQARDGASGQHHISPVMAERLKERKRMFNAGRKRRSSFRGGGRNGR